MEKKKLVFTVINDLTYDRRMDRICTSLVNYGYEVTLVGRELKSSMEIVKTAYHQKRIKCFFDRSILFYIEYNIRLFVYLLFSNFDLFGAIDLDTILPNKLVSKVKGKCFVFDSHEYFTEVIEIQNKPFVKAVWNLVAKLCLSSKTNAYTVSESYAKVFKELYGTNFEIIRNVPPKKKKLDIDKFEQFTFVYIGAVNEGRGLEESIEAIKGLSADLLICGDGDILNQLKEGLSEDQRDQVKFTGYLPPQELELMAAKCHVGLLILRSESLSYYYSLANKFFDYMHADIPQIVIDFPEYKDLVRKYEVALLTDISCSSIKLQMRTLLEDKEVYNRLKANIDPAAAIFSWEHEEVRLVTFYNKLWQKD